MASGTITLTRNSTGVYLIGQIVWSSVSNGTEANSSEVTATLRLQRDAANTTTGTFKGTFTVGGVSETISWYGSLPSRTWVTIKTITTTVNHSANGTGNCYLYAKINGPGATTMEGTYVSGSQTVALDTIPRYASIVSAPSFNDEENPKITYSNPAGNSVTSLEACISLDGSDDDVTYRPIDKTGTSYTFSLTEAERNVLRATTTGSNSRTVRFYIRTNIGGTTGRSHLSRTFTIKDPNPTINPTITDSNDATYALTGNRSKLVKYCSNVAITIGAAAVKQATLTSQKVTCGNKSLTANGTLNAVESNNFVFTATDSRGNTTTKTVTPSFVNYIKLTCNLSNNIPDTGGNMAVKVSGNYFNGSFGARNNSLTVYYRYKSMIGAFSNWTAMSVSYSGNTYSATANVSGLDYQTSYVFEAYAADALATVYSAPKTVKATPVFDWGENDFKFNVPVYDQTGALIGNSAAEWQNPPMNMGVEYRTTERFDGEPVYKKLINLGAFPNATSKNISHGIASAATLVSFEAFAQSTTDATFQQLPIVNTSGVTVSKVHLTAVNIILRTFSDLSGYTGHAVIKYTKG